MSWKKGLKDLIAAFTLISERHKKIKLVIAGSDENNYRSQLETLVSDLNIVSRVEFRAFVEGKEKQTLLANAFALALCSKNENFGNVVFEAMAHATPVIVTEGVGASSFVTEAACGYVVRRDKIVIAHAIERLIENPHTAKKMGVSGREVVKRHYSWSQIAKRMTKRYQTFEAS